MAAIGHFGFPILPKSIGLFYSGSSMAVSNMNLICALVSQFYVKHNLLRAVEMDADICYWLYYVYPFHFTSTILI